MKKLIILIMMLASLNVIQQANAQLIVAEIAKAVVTKVIKAADLNIQKQQNKVLWLQNAQKALENAMAKTKLREITDWGNKQKELYQGYFDELKAVKKVLTDFHRIKEIPQKQTQMVNEYKSAWTFFQKSDCFTSDELAYMNQVYAGMLNESAKNLDQLSMLTSSSQLQMSDGKRLALLNETTKQLDQIHNDLRAFNEEGMMLHHQRTSEKKELKTMKTLYGL